MLMSDHGFERKHMNIHVNDYLHDKGYLSYEGSSLSPAELAVETAKAVGKRSSFLYEKIRQVYNYIIATDIGQSLQEAAEPDIDYPNSEAWQIRYGCVYVNDGRFDHPTVDDPETLRQSLRDDLASLTDDDEPLFRDVLLSENAYTDPGDWAPDVIARPAPGCYPTMLESPTGGYVSDTNNYNHRYKGIFAATGPLFATNEYIEDASVVDILPTVMAALDIPLSPAFDGNVIRTAFDDDSTIEYRDAEAVPSPQTRSNRRINQKNRNDAVEQRLEDLGYME
jgi:predicted AlkP superfamily phosphohydrolase/phosphomutase